MSKVLIVDDDGELCRFLEEVLSIAGCSVQTAHDGKEALALLTQESGWLVLLDVEMPQMNGQEVIRQLQAHPCLGAHHQIALMSGNHLSAWKLQRSAPDLIRAVLPKPFELETLLYLIAQLETAQQRGTDQGSIPSERAQRP